VSAAFVVLIIAVFFIGGSGNGDSGCSGMGERGAQAFEVDADIIHDGLVFVYRRGSIVDLRCCPFYLVQFIFFLEKS
jgi:hypothetical protein